MYANDRWPVAVLNSGTFIQLVSVSSIERVDISSNNEFAAQICLG